MERKEWMRVLDHYLESGTMLSEDYEKMDYEQQNIIKEIKLSIKRLNYENSNLRWEEQKQNYRETSRP